jgi:hypothetical protein
MKKALRTAFMGATAATITITVLEKLLYRQQDLETLSQLLYSEGRSDINHAYPPALLFSKMIAWMSAALVAGIVIAYCKTENKRYVYMTVALFLMMGACINLAIVPHPSWLWAAVPALFVVPMLAGSRLCRFRYRSAEWAGREPHAEAAL